MKVVSALQIAVTVCCGFAGSVTWRQAARCLITSYAGNLLGCISFGYFMLHLTDLTSVDPYQSFIRNVTTSKIYQPWGKGMCGVGNSREIHAAVPVVTLHYDRTTGVCSSCCNPCIGAGCEA